jgi:DNA-binding transcriptional LysR family regulator
MSSTARKLYITQASVSQSIAEIEKKYNVRLFERLSKKLYLTKAGEELLVYAQQILSQEKTIEDFLHQASRDRILYIGASLSVGGSILSDLILMMKKHHPDVQDIVTVNTNSIIQEKLVNNALDIAIGDSKPKVPDLVCEPFMKDTLMLVCGRDHPFWGRQGILLKDLSCEKLIVRDSNTSSMTLLERLLTERDIPYQVAWMCADNEASKKAVRNGHGISTISNRLIQEEVNRGDMWALEILDADMSRTFNLMYHKDKYLPDYMCSFIELTKNFESLNPL